MKAVEFLVVEEARTAAKFQLSFFRQMMDAKKAGIVGEPLKGDRRRGNPPARRRSEQEAVGA